MQHRRAEALAAVDDAVADDIGIAQTASSAARKAAGSIVVPRSVELARGERLVVVAEQR